MIDRAFPGRHRDLTVVDIEIADAQAQRLDKPETGAIDQPDDALGGGGTGQRVEQAPDLVLGENIGHPLSWLFCLEAVDGARKLLLEHLPVEEQKRAKGLGLGRDRHSLLYSQVGEKRFNFRDIHGLGMTLIVKRMKRMIQRT